MNWKWVREQIEAPSGDPAGSGSREKGGQETADKNHSPVLPTSSPDIEVLNLFGYTGGATLACAQAGAKVVRVKPGAELFNPLANLLRVQHSE